jgi:hypothetical protein
VSDRDGRFDPWMRIVADDLEVFEDVADDRVRDAVELQLRVGTGVVQPIELLGDLVGVVVVDVHVAAGPDELSDVEAGLLGDYVGQQGRRTRC